VEAVDPHCHRLEPFFRVYEDIGSLYRENIYRLNSS